MPSKQVSKLLRKMRKAAESPRQAVIPALLQSGFELRDTMQGFAPVDTGALRESLNVTGPNEATPPYSQPGGNRVAGPTEVLVTAGNSDVRYPHLVEHGTLEAPAQPFFFVSYRLLRKRIIGRINRAVKKAVKAEWSKP